ncbi:MAG: TIGR03668 family PPOX class F420-dependent oxidoreductase [Alphaproteobacteria bacterium]|nr:TIGR03668 family PPOX class F420-dependent oxidoreductase [Alphaproteobacteria bacterium]
MLTPAQRRFLAASRVAHLATADGAGAPHVVPVCFIVEGDRIFIAIDEKPKRRPGKLLKRLANIADNPNVALVADHYDDADWSRLGWVMVRGPAAVLNGGIDARDQALAQRLLQARYPQLAAMTLCGLPVIAIQIRQVTSWGDLTATG